MLLHQINSEIKVKRAMNMIWNHHNQPSEASVSTTYDLNELIEYLHKCKLESNTHIRVYFGQYGDNTKLKPEDEGKKKYKTSIFVPAIKDENGDVIDNVKADPALKHDPFNEGQLCPPPRTCLTTNTLYQNTLTLPFDPAIPDEL
jgi:hypothetical protein